VRRRLGWAWSGLMNAASGVYMIELLLGAKWPWWYQMLWPGLMISVTAMLRAEQAAGIANRQLLEHYRNLFGQTFRDAARWN
jgi:hypothetical protein